MLDPLVDNNLVIVAVEISFFEFVLILVADSHYVEFSFVVVLFSVSVRIFKISINHHQYCCGEKCCEFFEDGQPLLVLTRVRFPMDEMIDGFVVDLGNFLIDLFEVLQNKVLCELYSLVFRKTHLLKREIIFPDKIDQINDVLDGFLVNFLENEFKKLTQFILPLQVNNQHLFLNLG